MESILGVSSIYFYGGSWESETTLKNPNRIPLVLLKCNTQLVFLWCMECSKSATWFFWMYNQFVPTRIYLLSVHPSKSDLESVAKIMLRCNTQISTQTTLFCHAPKGREIALPLWASLEGFSHWFSSIWRTHFKGRVYELNSLAEEAMKW